MEKKNITVKEMPSDQRPYEKCLALGAGALTDTELLAVIIRSGVKGERSLDLADRILQLSGIGQGLLGVCRVGIQDLMKIKGIGKVKAILIQCVAELSRRIAKKAATESLRFERPSTIADYYMEDFRHLEQEHLMVLLLNSKNRLLREQVIFKGTVNASLVSPREIFILALRYGAVNMILVHNHPSGDPSPSKADVDISRRIKQSGELIGIRMLDHIIIGDQKYCSLQERGII